MRAAAQDRCFVSIFGARDRSSAIWVVDTATNAMASVIAEGLAGGITGLAHDPAGADHLLPDLTADKAFDAGSRVLEPLAAAGNTAVIPPKGNRRAPRDFDRELYKTRHPIENFFARLKPFRAIATRYDKTACNFLGAVHRGDGIGRPPHPRVIRRTRRPGSGSGGGRICRGTWRWWRWYRTGR